MKYRIIAFSALCLSLAACGSKDGRHADWSEAREQAEAQGQELLTRSRQALAGGDYDGARERIREMRERHGLALAAREEGILLMDSIDLAEAQAAMALHARLAEEQPAAADSLRRLIDEDNTKVKFYLRKLEHDKNSRRER